MENKGLLRIIIFIMLSNAFLGRGNFITPYQFTLQANNFLINIRRDTSNGLPYGGTHLAGIGDIVWGNGEANEKLEITLERKMDVIVNRQVQLNSAGEYNISVDRIIEDGDVITVSNGIISRSVTVPSLIYKMDLLNRLVTGVAPANIVSTQPGSPHSLAITLGGTVRQVTTNSTGEFTADFSAHSYLAGLLGSLLYITSEGDHIYQPIFTVDPIKRGALSDWIADEIIGQPDFSEITPNQVTSNLLFNPAGTYIDKSVNPNRIYLYDGGNSRILGFRSMGLCYSGINQGKACTSKSDCPASTCNIQEDRPADIVLGQTSFSTAACNEDSGYQYFPEVSTANASTLCSLREEQTSITEGGSGANMATDPQGNLYVPDFFNNRVLRYNDPFQTDTQADFVWGQDDFNGIHCNRGAYNQPDATSLCLAPPPGIGDVTAGVATDQIGDLWVADNENNRVLRFPFSTEIGRPSTQSDLVLGQSNFTSKSSGFGLNQMWKPAAVTVDDQGTVYVADSLNNRVLVFDPPFTNGMYANHVLADPKYLSPSGLSLDLSGHLWVNYQIDYVVRYSALHEDKEIIRPGHSYGGLGLDRDENVWLAISDGIQEGRLYTSPDYTNPTILFKKDQAGDFNYTQNTDLGPGFSGLEVAAGQLIVSDGVRLIFWNNVWNLTRDRHMDGVIGQPDFYTRPKWAPLFGRIRADPYGRLWVIHGGQGIWPQIETYALPLKNGEAPTLSIQIPVPVLGGGELSWSESLNLGGIDYDPKCDCIWLTDEDNNRAFRIREASSKPVVDIILGQVNLSGNQCNQGRGEAYPSRDSLCHPGALTLDNAGNLFISDHNTEFDGNHRLLEWNASTIPASLSSASYGIPADHILGNNGDFTKAGCSQPEIDPMCGPFEVAFDSQGNMVVGFNAYLGQRFPLVYHNPLANPFPIAAISDYQSMAISTRFDDYDNLYILDGNRGRVLIYKRREVKTFQVDGNVKNSFGQPVEGVYLEMKGYASNDISDINGAYILSGLVKGSYTIVPAKNQCTFSPASLDVAVNANQSVPDFIAHCPNDIYLPILLSVPR